MRIEFVKTESRYKARKTCLWANVVTKVFEGFMCFESINDYKIWKNQR